MTRIMRKLMTLIASIIAFGAWGATPAASTVLNNSAKKISSMPSLTATFTISQDGKTATGNILLQGDRFALTTKGSISTWYDGKTQWVYNPSTQEINISTPTPEELETVNPFVIIKSFQNSYNARQLKAPAGSYVIELTPKKKASDISRVELTINASTQLPTKAVVTLRGGSKAVIGISGIKQGAKQPMTSFAPQKKAYPQAEFIDLR